MSESTLCLFTTVGLLAITAAWVPLLQAVFQAVAHHTRKPRTQPDRPTPIPVETAWMQSGQRPAAKV